MSDPPNAAGLAFARQRAAMAITGTTGPEKAVLLVLAIMANAAGEAWPPIDGPKGITSKSSLGRRTVFDALRSLETMGLLTRFVDPGKSTTYRLHLEGCGSRTGAPPAPVRDMHQTGAPPAPEQPVPTILKKTSSSPKRRAEKITFDVPDGVPIDAWNGWLAMRRAIGKGLDTQRAYDIAVKKLKALADDGHPPGDVLDQSTLAKWTGVFPLKDNRHGNQRSGASGRPTPGSESAARRAAFDSVEL